MRILISKESKKQLFCLLKNKHSAKSIQELSEKINISIKTLQNWFYSKERYIPEKIIEKDWYNKLKIIDKKEDNWGRIKGGKEAYNKLIKQIGAEGIRLQQSLGGKKAAIIRTEKEKENFK